MHIPVGIRVLPNSVLCFGNGKHIFQIFSHISDIELTEFRTCKFGQIVVTEFRNVAETSEDLKSYTDNAMTAIGTRASITLFYNIDDFIFWVDCFVCVVYQI